MGLFAAFAALLLLLWCVQALVQSTRHGDEARLASFVRSVPEGERLSLERLQSNEQIVIEHIENGHRRSSAHTYMFIGGEIKGITIAERRLEMDSADNLRAGDSLLATSHTLTPRQVEGVDAFLRMLRRPQPGVLRYYDTYAIVYQRNGQTIGREARVDFYQPADWATDATYADLPPDLQTLTTPEDWPRLISFRRLTRTLRMGLE